MQPASLSRVHRRILRQPKMETDDSRSKLKDEIELFFIETRKWLRRLGYRPQLQLIEIG